MCLDSLPDDVIYCAALLDNGQKRLQYRRGCWLKLLRKVHILLYFFNVNV